MRGAASRLDAIASGPLTDSQGWSRRQAPVSGAWRLRTDDDYALVFAPVSADLLSVGVSSSCSRP